MNEKDVTIVLSMKPKPNLGLSGQQGKVGKSIHKSANSLNLINILKITFIVSLKIKLMVILIYKNLQSMLQGNTNLMASRGEISRVNLKLHNRAQFSSVYF